MATPSYEYPVGNVDTGSALAMIAAHNSKAEASEDCFAIQVTTDFMEPLLRNGDWVVIDPQDRRLIDAIYVIDMPQGDPLVARLQHVGDGMVRVFGDNQHYRSNYITVEDAPLLIAGRVRHICKRV